MKQKFYKCNVSGNIITMVKDTGASVMCCDREMEEMIPGTSDGAKEKHVPGYKVDGNLVTVNIGEIEHPMEDNHYIEWVSLQTKQGNQIKFLKPGEKPEVVFAITEDDEVEAVYEYCNLHGLWKK